MVSLETLPAIFTAVLTLYISNGLIGTKTTESAAGQRPRFLPAQGYCLPHAVFDVRAPRTRGHSQVFGVGIYVILFFSFFFGLWFYDLDLEEYLWFFIL